jgi:hypothetical protein
MIPASALAPVQVHSWRAVERPRSATRNLVLVHSPGYQDISDFVKMRSLIAERAPDIEVFIAHAEQPCSVTRRKAARRPSLVFSPTPLARFRPRSGKIYCGRRISKLEQMRRLQAEGVLTPEAVPFDETTELDPANWGELTVVKPDFGGRGEDVAVLRTREIRRGRQPLWPADDPRHRWRMLAQKFVDTGLQPTKYRMLVLFGRPLYCEEQASVAPSPPFDPDGDGPIPGLTTSTASSHSTAGTRRTRVCYDADVLALAPRTAAAFPEIALLGLDILREIGTERLYVLETNPGGYTWHLSSGLGRIAQQRLGIDRYAQFDALSVAADALIEKTRAEAVL